MAVLQRALFLVLFVALFLHGSARKPNQNAPAPSNPSAGGVGSDDERSIKEQSSAANMENDFETVFKGYFRRQTRDAKVPAMQMQMLPNTKVISIDTISFGPSNISLPPPHPANCRQVAQKPVDKDHPAPQSPTDCFAHALESEFEAVPKGANIRPLKLVLDTWGSSGGLSPNGTLVSTGGFEGGSRAVRHLDQCPTCDFVEKPDALASNRWYATQATLEDGNFVVVGGRKSYSYEFIPSGEMNFPPKQIDLPFLRETEDSGSENNLYPFVHLVPDGNLFIFANKRSILLEPATGKVIREYPVLPGGARNFPASGMSALLPLDLRKGPNVEAEVLICGGGDPAGLIKAEKEKVFLPALNDCGRIAVTKPDAQWEIDQMPSPRVMGDMIILPNTNILILNGAKKGVSGWGNAAEPNMMPLLYSPNKNLGQRFSNLSRAVVPRTYRSSVAMLLDGKVLVSGTIANATYSSSQPVAYLHKALVEKYSPPYLTHFVKQFRPRVHRNTTEKNLKYGQQFRIKVKLDPAIGISKTNVKVVMYAPGFTTHGYSMNQRMVILNIVDITENSIFAVAPPSGKIAPRGYYMFWVVHRGLPSNGIWVRIDS